MQSQRFLTEIWAEGAPKLEICSSSWKSMVEQERLDGAYAAFVTELHRRLAQAGVAARFEQGTNPVLLLAGPCRFSPASRSALAGADACARCRRMRWAAPLRRRVSAAVSLAGRQFFSPQPARPLSGGAPPPDLMPRLRLLRQPQLGPAPSDLGVTKRSSRPERGCSLLQSSTAKSMMTRPEVGSFSRSRSRVSTSPEAISISASFVQAGIVPDHQQAMGASPACP